MKIEVIINTPPRVKPDEIASFVEDALSTWGGQFHPADPLFHSLDIRYIRIKKVVYNFEEEKSNA